MEETMQALQSNNGIIIAILIAIIVMLLAIGAKYGIVKIKTEKLKVGYDGLTPEQFKQKLKEARALEQRVMDHQKDWVKIAVNAFYQKIPAQDQEDYDEFRGRFLIEKSLNEIIDWIMINHIEDKKTYVELKQELVWNLVLSYTTKDELRSEKFKKEVYAYVEYIIKNLVRIRKQYDNEE